jgi:hypothetical protein
VPVRAVRRGVSNLPLRLLPAFDRFETMSDQSVHRIPPPTYTLNLEIDPKSVKQLQQSGKQILLARFNPPAFANVVWMDLQPAPSIQISWKEQFGVFAATTTLQSGNVLRPLDQKDSVQPGRTYLYGKPSYWQNDNASESGAPASEDTASEDAASEDAASEDAASEDAGEAPDDASESGSPDSSSSGSGGSSPYQFSPPRDPKVPEDEYNVRNVVPNDEHSVMQFGMTMAATVNVKGSKPTQTPSRPINVQRAMSKDQIRFTPKPRIWIWIGTKDQKAGTILTGSPTNDLEVEFSKNRPAKHLVYVPHKGKFYPSSGDVQSQDEDQ